MTPKRLKSSSLQAVDEDDDEEKDFSVGFHHLRLVIDPR